MKCPDYGSMKVGSAWCEPSPECERAHRHCNRRGWLITWDASEVAGMKAIGKLYKNCYSVYRKEIPIMRIGINAAIRAYVKASRAAKEGK